MLRNISYHPLVFDMGGAGGRFIKTLGNSGAHEGKGGATFTTWEWLLIAKTKPL